MHIAMQFFRALGLGMGLALPLVAAAQTQPAVSRHIFQDADRNNDGYVDLDEFHKDIVRSFHALDHNRDSYITVEEIRAIPDAGRVERLLLLLKRADTDGDGRLSFKEVVEVRMSFFTRADANKDDRLALEEVVSYDATGSRQFAATPDSKAGKSRTAK